MRIAFITPYPIGQAPSQRFRFEHYFSKLKEDRIEFKTFSFLDEQSWKNLYKANGVTKKIQAVIKGIFRRTTLLTQLSNFDIVYIHREATPIGPPIFEWIIAKVLRKKIIYDFDDAIYMSDDSASNIFIKFIRSKSKVKKICKWSSAVSCGNNYLASFASQYNTNVFVIPTVVDTEFTHNSYHQIKKNQKVTIGWTGTHSTLPYLDELYPIIENLQKTLDFNFLIIANKDPKPLNVKYQFSPWNKNSEIKDLDKIDIGIMPLLNTPWAEGKCGFKAIQYMALGIPAVVSAVGVNNHIVDDGINGFIIHNTNDWKAALKKLIESPELREKFGKNARQKMIQNYSVLSSYPLFINLLHSVE